MTEAMTLIAIAGSGLAGLSIAAYAGLKGWQGWLDLKRLELAAQRTPERGPAMDRIEMADLRERIRKLESIASCVDL
jgi:thioredoxin reductase